ncbi:MAG: hypothetical protein L3J77_05155, partial [Thermoplasmata archaeon]|nr:hypothetical protein [Thermoplasmata archaeon]
TIVANGGSFSSTAASIVVVESDGSVSYTVNSVQGYTAQPNSSSLTVDGSIVAVAIVFTPLPPTYGVNFAESGLPSGTNWSVTVAGVLENSTQPTITFHVTNGTSQFSVAIISAFTRAPATGTVHVAGKDVLINVTFTPVTSGTSTPGGASPAGLSGLFGYGAAAAGAAVGGAIGAAVALTRRGRSGGSEPAVPVDPPPS